uniref:PH domain-containing protein n=1 Tax=Phaeomonas parva TaxID=124430 RepID=A0A6U4KP04_9STRA|mmetsp:Transcript_6574/g.18632  ORF Transcript_6574/g.18632 Transcript_6574/m.18632 type:complete len:962 (+) Transcript_6574:72-2957(+)
MFGLGRKRKKKSKSPPPRAPSGCAVPPHVDANSLGLGLPEDVDLTEGFQAHPPKGKLSPAGSPEKPSDELASSIRAELEANLSWPFEKGTFKGTLEANGAAGLLTLSRCLEFHLWKAVDNWIEVCADAPERVAYAIESLRMSERTLELMAASYAGEVPEVGDEHEVADAMERAGAIADAIGTTARAVLVGASEGQNGGAAASEDDDDAPPPTRLSEKGMAPLDRRLRERLRRAAQRECDAFLGRAVARFHEKEQEQCELMLALLEQTEFERIKFERRNSSNAEDNKNNRAVGEAASIKGVMYKVGSGTNLIYEPRWFVIEPTADTLYLAYYKRGSLRRRLDLVDAVDVREAEERASAVFFAERRTLPPGATQFRTIQLEMRSNVDGSDHTSVFHLCSPTEHDFWLSVITKAFLLLEPIRQLKYAEQATPLPNNADGDGDGEGEAADTAFGWRMRAALGKMRHGVKDQAKPVGVTALDARRKAPSEGAANVQQLTSNIAQNRDGLQRLRGLSDADSASGPSSRRGSQRYNRASSGGTAVDCNAIEEEERAGTPSPHFDGAKPGEKSAKPALELVFMLRACTSLVDRCDVVLRRAALLPRELGVAELAYAAMEADFCAWLNPYLPFLHEEEDKSRVAMAAAQAIRMGDLAERIGAAPSEDLWRLRRHAKTVFCERLSTSLSHILKDVLFKETSEAREARAIEPSLVNKRGTWRGPLRRMLQRRTMKTLRKEEEEAERPASDSGTLVVVGERPFTNFRIDALSFTQETIRIARRLLASHIADVRSACVLALCDAQRVRMDAIKRTVARMELQHLVASLNDTKYLYDKLEGWLEPQNDDEEMQLDEQVGVGPRNWLFFDAEPCRVVHMETTEKASKGRMDVPEHTVTLSEFIEEAVCYFAKAQQQIVLYMSAWSMANLRLLDIGMNLFTHEWATDDRNTDGPKFTVRLWGENFTALREMLAEMVD